MENWSLEATHLRHLRVDMKWVPIVAKSVKEGLIVVGHFLLDEVWGPLGNLRDNRLNCTLVAKSSKTAHKET